MKQEIWKKVIIDGEETFYSVSSCGRVRNDKRKSFLGCSTSDGYITAALHIGGEIKRKRIHRLVAEAFIPNPEGKPYVNHIDGNRKNNNLENLEWVTPSENTQHAFDTGLIGYQRVRPVRQYNLQGELLMIFDSTKDAAEQTGCLACKITDVCKGNRKTTGDYQWRYDDEELDSLPPVSLRSNKKRKVGQYDKAGNLIAIYSSYREAARAVGGNESAISRVCSGVNHTHKGYGWRVVDDIVQEEIE